METIRVMIQSAAGSTIRRRYNEQNLEYQGDTRTILPHPYPYGFILDTHACDGDNLDCFIITRSPLKPGTIVECLPWRLLEMREERESDDKVLAKLPGEEGFDPKSVREELARFIKGIFRAFPMVSIKLGRLLSQKKTISYIESNRVHPGGCRENLD